MRDVKYITDDMGYGPRIEHMFASGPMGVAKPDRIFFETSSETLQLAPESILLIDDSAKNTQAAQALS